MNYAEAEQIFRDNKGVTFVTIDTVSNVSLKGGAKNPFKDRVTKRTVGSNVMVASMEKGSAYVNMVKRRMEKEGKNPDDWTPAARPWGTRISGTPFIEHNGKYYIEVIFMKAGKSTYHLDGIQIADPTEIQGFEYPKKDEEVSPGQGGIEDKVIVRTYALENITSMKANNEVYEFAS